jgi:ubiquinone/menaquinone biosynthesis C-methylase UbiE
MIISTSSKFSQKWVNFTDAYENTFEVYSKVAFQLLAPFVEITPDCVVLDSACGSGVGVEILKSIDDRVQIYANDFSKSMITKVMSKGFFNVQAVVANSLCLPYPDSFFNRYIANLALHVVSDHKKMIQEAHRVLKSGGKAIFSYPVAKGKNDILYILCKALRTLKIGPRSNTASKYFKSIKSSEFRNIRTFESAVGTHIETGDQAVELIKPLQDIAKLKDTDKYHHVLQLIALKAQKRINQGKAIILGIKFVIAYK